MPRIGTITTTLSARLTSHAEEARWRSHIRFLYGDDAEKVIERANAIYTTTAMDRSQAREQAESEVSAIYAERIRSLI